MALVLKNIYSAYFNIIVDKRDVRLNDYFLMGSPWKIIGILTVYWLFIRKFGPKLMENVEPFELKTVLKLYNIVQILANLYMTFAGIGHVISIHRNSTKFLCYELDYSNSELGIYGAQISYIYLINKVFDLCDTVFFILRKRYNQATFLHVYHHILICFGAWAGVQYFPAAQAVLFGTMNSFIHSIMYGYYYITSQNASLKNSIWWKKYLTKLQLIQFAIGIIIFSVPIFSTNCNYPIMLSLFALIQNVVMFVMFTNFYRNAYLKKSN